MTIINNKGEGKNLIGCINRHFHEDISIFSLHSFFKKGSDKHGGQNIGKCVIEDSVSMTLIYVVKVMILNDLNKF